MSVGFTGTRKGMLGRQRELVGVFLRSLVPVVGVHHGDCVGADAEFHDMAKDADLFVYIHPPADDRQRAGCAGWAWMGEPLPYLERNHAIVDAVDLLIAAPDGPEKQRSGTWATVRYALRVGVQVVVFYP